MKTHSKPDFEEVMNSEKIYRIPKKVHYPSQIPNPRSQDRSDKGDNRYFKSDDLREGIEYNNKYKSAPPPQDFNRPSKNFANNKNQLFDYRNPPSHHQIEKLNPNYIIDNSSGFESFKSHAFNSSHKPASEGKRSKTEANLKNLISKSKNSEEIDLFENNELGDNKTQKDLDNYWYFLESNMINKNLAVIPIEDDDSPKVDLGMHKYPLKDLAKWNRKKWNRTYIPPKKKPQQLEIQDIIKREEEMEKRRMERAPWLNCFEMSWPRTDIFAERIEERKPKMIKLE